ncbi:MAG: hypothetical protein V3T07_03165, partial [Myxococcota bacterium]
WVRGAVASMAALLLCAPAAVAHEADDTDLDGVHDPLDNCTLAANADQRDTDGDGYGNACDPDLNNDDMVDFLDLGQLKSNFFTADADSDLNGDGNVDFLDLGMMKSRFFQAPGPTCDTCLPEDCDGAPVDFDSTFEAIQTVIFDSATYSCTNGICHGSPIFSGGLDLRAGFSYDELLNEPATSSLDPRVTPAEAELSFLFEKLSAATLGTPLSFGAPMPFVGPALTPDHLQAVRDWIHAGAPDDGVVEGTAELLGTCLPPTTPNSIPDVDPPPLGAGLQLVQPAWDLPPRFENEVCMAAYFDFTQTNLVPESAKVPCPDEFQLRKGCTENLEQECSDDSECAESCVVVKGALNPGSECFIYDKTLLAQDPQSHHSILLMYTGTYGVDHSSWGAYTKRYKDPDHPENGQPCDPTDIDPALGYNPYCGSEVVESIACLTFGPPDFINFTGIFSSGGNAPQILISQEAYFDRPFPDTVYDVFPMKGLAIWNSHAFNLTDLPTRHRAFLNLEFADPAVDINPLVDLFDVSSIFIQNVPPFETREYCATWTAPQGSRLFRIASHTHRHGVKWRMWAPPNSPCSDPCPDGGSFICFGDPAIPACDGPRPDEEKFYESTTYSDPLNLFFDPPLAHDDAAVESRTYLNCSVYDNGATPTSPEVKRQSTSPLPPLGTLGLVLGGGPCNWNTVACLNEGPNQGALCGVDDGSIFGARNHSLCHSASGADDGVCDACPVLGGVTTEDEMFAILGDYFFP